MAKSEYDCVEQFFLEEANLFLSETRLEDCVEVALKNAGQALFWGCSVLDLHKRHGKYDAFLQNDSARDIVSGIRFARNRVAHNFFQLLKITDGAAFPITLPTKFQEIRWKSINELPLADPRFEKQERKGAECFERSMENRPVRFALRDLVDYFARARSALAL
jgi:hypothetical protein